MVRQKTVYRLWDSDVGYVEIATDGWLETAIAQSGMRYPRRAQFHSQGEWIDVSRFALARAIHEAGRVFA
jgi:hypothetical protein